jgi:hypothetical protein
MPERDTPTFVLLWGTNFLGFSGVRTLEGPGRVCTELVVGSGLLQKRTCGGGVLWGGAWGRALVGVASVGFESPGSMVQETQRPVAELNLAAVSSHSGLGFDRHEAGTGVLVSPYLSDLSGPG